MSQPSDKPAGSTLPHKIKGHPERAPGAPDEDVESDEYEASDDDDDDDDESMDGDEDTNDNSENLTALLVAPEGAEGADDDDDDDDFVGDDAPAPKQVHATPMGRADSGMDIDG